MSTFKVTGGKKLKGTYECSGAKNSGPKLIIAAILSGQTCTLHNIPRISDSQKIIDAVNLMGGEAKWTGDHSVEVNCASFNNPEVPEVVLTARHAVLFIGATLARLGKLRIAKIGGDDIGKRPVNRLLSGLKCLGAEMSDHDDYLEMSLPDRPAATTYTFEKNTHTGTESLVLGAIFAEGKVVINNAAAEPEVDDLIEFLFSIGAKVSRTEPRQITVEGVPKLLAGGEARSMYDRLEGATALALAAMNGGDITVVNIDPLMVREFTDFLTEIGLEIEWDGDKATVKSYDGFLKPATIKTDIYPGFMTDWQPLGTLLLATSASGQSTVHEMIYEQRWSALRELGKMGVKFELFQPEGYTSQDYNFNESEYKEAEPYGAYVHGPTELQAAELVSRDVRAGVDVLLAALFAKGESTILDPDGHIDRGYEDIVGKLARLGADITRE